jgi:hypothetical protein
MARDAARRWAQLFVKWFPILWLVCLVGGMAASSFGHLPLADTVISVVTWILPLGVLWLFVWLVVGPRLKAGYLLFAWFMLYPVLVIAVDRWTGKDLLDRAHPFRSLCVVLLPLIVPALVDTVYKLFRPHRYVAPDRSDCGA